MKFLFVVHGWYLGGFATFCRNLALGLRQRHHTVALLVLPEMKSEVSPGVFDEFVVVPRGLCRLNVYVQRVVEAIEGLRPDVLVLNDSPYGMAALPFIRRSILRIPVIHSGEADEVELGLSQGLWWDRVLVVSDSVAQAVKGRCREPRVSVCPLGVPLPEEKRPRGHARGPLELISVGRVEVHQKRMDRIPAIARLLAEQGIPYYWTVLGDGAYLPRLCQEISRAGLAERFRFAGGVGPSAVREALHRAEVLILPSDCEGMPQALLEAMAQGVVPVVSRIAGATTNLVEEGKTGYLCAPGKAADFARAVGELAGDRGRCAEVGSRAAARIAQHFSLEGFLERFLAAVTEVSGGAAQRPAALSRSRRLLGQPAVRCLGFWRNLRSQSLGRCKRWWLGRWSTLLTRPGRVSARSLSGV
jgi:glycosyltransferase involved in cell wall biosynthesis